MWRVSDYDLASPLGAVIDVGVDARQTVYLLDSQVKEVRRIAADGRELPPLGREGEGPGEFVHPALVAGAPDGSCIVVQDFHAPAVCLSENGQPCAAPDLNVIRRHFGMTAFMGTARTDEKGRLIMAATTTERPYDPARPDAALGRAVSVFRIQRGDRQPAVLFTNSPGLGDEHTVRYHPEIAFYPLRSWDVGPTGRLIYAEPNGGYRVLIGHPADGGVEPVDLIPARGDEGAIAKRAKAEGLSVGTYPRIADVQWITDSCFLIKPVAADTGARIWQTGVFELLDLKGASLGRRTISCDYNPDQDSLFLRGSVMVLLRNGRSAYLASIRKEPDAPARDYDAHDYDEVVVEAYDLIPR